ncbi:hypothetical protein [Collimonas arenae]|uniref:hypothetical protein n=1 Tax=Collimonas arenae TaxID=279058 RepID=UPI0012E080E6|nr:hypothetical protein [Collimonas arenae]
MKIPKIFFTPTSAATGTAFGDGNRRDFSRTDNAHASFYNWLFALQNEERIAHLKLGALLVSPLLLEVTKLRYYSGGVIDRCVDYGNESPTP